MKKLLYVFFMIILILSCSSIVYSQDDSEEDFIIDIIIFVSDGDFDNLYEEQDISDIDIDELLEELRSLASIPEEERTISEWKRIIQIVLVKTAEGLIIQEMILKKLAEKYNLKYQLANKEQESKGIDGYIGNIPISIKPKSYESKKTTVRDKIEVQIVYYKKTDKYLTIYYDDISNNSA